MLELRYFLLIFFLISLASCSKSPSQRAQPSTPVSVVRVLPQTIPADFENVGVAESSHIVEIRARVEGYLQQIAYQEGGFVHADDLLFVLDQRPFVAALESAQGSLARAQAVLWNAQQSKARMIPLYKENAVSQKDLDDAVSTELSSNADVISAAAQVETAKLNLGFTCIQAPVSGMASQAKYREGALISPTSDNLLTTIYVIDPIWVNFSVSDGDILRARKERASGRLVFPENMDFTIEIVMADGSILPASGKIDFVNPSLQQSTGTMLVRAVLPNPNMLLKPGQFVRVIVKGATRPDAVIVPQAAVLQGQDGVFVYVVDENNHAAVRPVEVGNWYKDFWVINSGLKKDDIVIVEGVNKVQNGSAVNITKWAADKPTEAEDKMSLEGIHGF